VTRKSGTHLLINETTRFHYATQFIDRQLAISRQIARRRRGNEKRKRETRRERNGEGYV